MSLRPDREDVSAQLERLAQARADYAVALERVLAECAGDSGLAEVAAETQVLLRRLRSTAKRPPALDTAAWAGAVSAATRAAARADAWDQAVAEARAAETAVDLAALDVHTARGGDV